MGSIGSNHVFIQKPPNSGSSYLNYKGSFSIVRMAIVNTNYQFIMVDVGANGRVSDDGVLKNTLFGRRLVIINLICLLLAKLALRVCW